MLQSEVAAFILCSYSLKNLGRSYLRTEADGPPTFTKGCSGMEASCFTSEILQSMIWKHLTAKWNTSCHKFPGLQAVKTPAAITCTSSGHYSIQFCIMVSALPQDLTSSGAQLTWWMRSQRRKGSAGNCRCERWGWAEEEKAETTVPVPRSVPQWTGLCCL